VVERGRRDTRFARSPTRPTWHRIAADRSSTECGRPITKGWKLRYRSAEIKSFCFGCDAARLDAEEWELNGGISKLGTCRGFLGPDWRRQRPDLAAEADAILTAARNARILADLTDLS
jgi:hypothetical protein